MQRKIRLIPAGIEFLCKEGQTVLDAALSNNIHLEYGCSNGRCGQCKAGLLEGGVVRSKFDANVELPANAILACCSVPQTDLLLNAQYFPELNDIERKTIPAKVDGLSFINKDILVMSLRIPPTVTFKFKPGQYIDLFWNGSKRSYSIANSCVQENKIELHIRKVTDGLFSDFMFNELKENHLFRFFGPSGTFFLRAGAAPLIFLCTGSGFAPVKSMVESLIEAQALRKIHIFWGGRFIEDLYSDLPFQWARKFENIQFTPVLSREKNATENTKLGYVQNVLVDRYDNLHEKEVYACGSQEMIHDARKLLIKSGLNSKNFHSDAFVSSN